jgi:o-succinylbenzoate synthase
MWLRIPGGFQSKLQGHVWEIPFQLSQTSVKYGSILIMRYQLQFRPYRRRFLAPVRLGSDLTDSREGILIRLEGEDGEVGFGEVAPLESFGSESVQRSLALLRSFCGTMRREGPGDLDPRDFPCTRYALAQAVQMSEPSAPAGSRVAEFTPTAVLRQRAESFETDGNRPIPGSVYKCKIAHVDGSPDQERAGVLQWAKLCHENDAKLRLDANEGLDRDGFMDWITFLEPFQEVVEFIEQPLDRWDLEGMSMLSEQSPIPIALDESLSLLRGDWDWESAPGNWLYVVKPSLGDLLWMPPGMQDRIIWSSVFETGVGFQQLLDNPRTPWLPGFDTQQCFVSDGLEYPKTQGGYLSNQVDPEAIWKKLG